MLRLELILGISGISGMKNYVTCYLTRNITGGNSCPFIIHDHQEHESIQNIASINISKLKIFVKQIHLGHSLDCHQMTILSDSDLVKNTYLIRHVGFCRLLLVTFVGHGTLYNMVCEHGAWYVVA